MKSKSASQEAIEEDNGGASCSCGCACRLDDGDSIQRKTHHTSVSHQLMRSRIRDLHVMEAKLQEMIKRTYKIVAAQKEFIMLVQDERQRTYEITANTTRSDGGDNDYVPSLSVLLEKCCKILTSK